MSEILAISPLSNSICHAHVSIPSKSSPLTIEKDGFATESKEPSKEQVENQFEVEAQEMEMTPMQVFKLEKDKRRFRN